MARHQTIPLVFFFLFLFLQQEGSGEAGRLIALGEDALHAAVVVFDRSQATTRDADIYFCALYALTWRSACMPQTFATAAVLLWPASRMAAARKLTGANVVASAKDISVTR